MEIGVGRAGHLCGHHGEHGPQALAAGADLGGGRAVLLMQSSGVGNCINLLSLIAGCKFPFLTLVSMRGEFEPNTVKNMRLKEKKKRKV